MEKRVNKRVDSFISSFKDNIRDKATELGMIGTDETNQLLQYMYDHERLVFDKEDFQKRKRVKNFVPICDRCCAKKSSEEQCTRRRKKDHDYCGTHLKGLPHGVIDSSSVDITTAIQKVEVWAEDINGIICYIDRFNNVYRTEDIVGNKLNPSIIAKYAKSETGEYTIPGFMY